MNIISFRNKGLIDLRAVRTFGISAKEIENPIGFFGTGLKYAIAICLRLNCKVTLWRGLERIDFVTAEVKVRNADFRVVTMTSEYENFELGFTTDLGKTWEPWQAFRELYCNTTDEGGETIDGRSEPESDYTTITIEGSAFYSAYHERNQIILTVPPQWEAGHTNIHNRRTDLAYYRGIRVGKLQHAAIMTYDVRSNLELTEDRTLKNVYQYYSAIREAVLTTEDEGLIARFLTAPSDSFEAHLDLDAYTIPSETFLRIMEAINFRECHNHTARMLYKKHRKCVLVPDAIPLNRIETQQLHKAIEFCDFGGWRVKDYEIIVTSDLAEGVWGQAYEGKIYINRSAFASGTKIVAGTLIEEYIHLRHGLSDESRALQNHLLNALVSMGELAMGVPL